MSNLASSGDWIRKVCTECRKRKIKCEDRCGTTVARCKPCVKANKECSWSQAPNPPAISANAGHPDPPQSLEDGTMVRYNTGNGPSTAGGYSMSSMGNDPNAGGGSSYSTSLNTMTIPDENSSRVLFALGKPVPFQSREGPLGVCHGYPCVCGHHPVG
ncbi:hypothetical protein PM082_012139 [Marasmius tenuissimus]|nr:hypothetical protein PM082_012139 [Marasmius tenuissimus]